MHASLARVVFQVASPDFEFLPVQFQHHRNRQIVDNIDRGAPRIEPNPRSNDRRFYQDGLTGSAWGDWSNFTDSPLRAEADFSQDCGERGGEKEQSG